MSAKRKSLGAALQAAKEEQPITTKRGLAEREADPAEQGTAYTPPPSRQGKRFIGAHFEPEVAIQLKVLAATSDTTSQELLRDALNLLFVKHGQNPIA